MKKYLYYYYKNRFSEYIISHDATRWNKIYIKKQIPSIINEIIN